MKIHPRERNVQDAENALNAAVMRVFFDEHKLTIAEELSVVVKVLGDYVATVTRYAIRTERHEDADEPGGLE